MSFIKGHSISKNTVINQEIVHSMSSKRGQGGWIAIKIDIQKAFDRLRWDFIENTLVDAGIPHYLIRIILHCITSSSLQVQWNGALGRAFQPPKGIRQGDPLSSYLFNLTTERLSHAISDSVVVGQWNAFKLAQNGSPISHLFFADDLILYAKADIENAATIDSILSTFGAHSSHLDNWLPGVGPLHSFAAPGITIDDDSCVNNVVLHNDAAVDSTYKTASVGGVIRDVQGQWLVGYFARLLQKHSGAWAVLLGLEVDRMRGSPFGKQWASTITLVTAYAMTTNRRFDMVGTDICPVGDYDSMVDHSHDTTLPISLEEMLLHCCTVASDAD
ncbi:hypothetical protein V6N12_005687 [Hibiscus sabdariffa]|uniref:3-methyl-2-oxobutanoate hydroxymethyltransferase n=1 Tax=Hibiscus sabdariffa TaxID=183260 RepID=A0ABR2BCJ1_9ROSI